MKCPVLMVFTVAIAALFAGCGNDSSPTGSAPTADQITGTWTLTWVNETSTLTTSGSGAPGSPIQEDTSFAPSGNNTIVFRADSTFLIVFSDPKLRGYFGYNMAGRWTLSGGQISLFSQRGDTTYFSAGVNGSQGIFVHTVNETGSEQGITYTYSETVVIQAIKQ